MRSTMALICSSAGVVVLALHLHVRQQPVVGAARQVGEEVAERGEALQAARVS